MRLPGPALALLLCATPVLADTGASTLRLSVRDLQHMLFIEADYSCSPRKTCSKTVRNCDEAYWLLENCPWGHRLDGDGDGVPCESMCPGG